MAGQEYFKTALSDFAFEAASGGAIRHLADLGYTVRQMKERLTFPTPYERVQKTVWRHLLDQGILLQEEPGSVGVRERAVYVREYDKYGKPSFRRVVLSEDAAQGMDGGAANGNAAHAGMAGSEGMTGSVAAAQTAPAGGAASWKEVYFAETASLDFARYIKEKCAENGQENSFCACDFGQRLYHREKNAGFMDALQDLEEPLGDYILGLPWEIGLCYHRLDERMRKIIAGLYARAQYQGNCYFLKTKERLHL